MFDNSDSDRRRWDRGQVGIGTLIVFIAMVLVAAIAAGVLINTAGFLQSKSEAAGQQSGDQVTNRLEVASATGSVDQGTSQVTDVDVTVKQAPGADNVDLRNVTVSWVESGGTYKLVSDVVDHTATSADGRFAVTAFKDADDSAPVLNDPDDRFTMVFDLDADPGTGQLSDSSTDVSQGGDVDWEESNLENNYDFLFSDHLGEGQVVTLKLTTQSGATNNVRLVVPQSLSGTSAVNL
ncbi:flagellin [Halapricum sp. CBA1109]|uniref:archaellin/type IV pilin N-terminal domain-containing protein n=1 Tax=Halapricum sp. CBA1109 TaxID=2668068 RepID=UPI0012F75DFC|nr:archaellin/type IV pilin N-terminal domain-containing protein [Halapricum sp. CBA1109]MUV90331.1 flagellin [Halapricum sp. CBA1109]